MECAMKAMVYHQYGSPDVLQLQEVEKSVPQGDEVLVAVVAAAVNWLDWHFLTGKPLMTRLMAGLFSPKNHVLGIDMAGRVEAVGANVTQFKTGDEVFGSPDHGCYAEYVCVPEANILPKPANITFNQAAAVFGAGVTALHALRDYSQVKPGQKVLINGASGGLGTFAVQIAKTFGAEVTGVCSTRNLELVRSIGADHVVDYTQEDFTWKGNRYDLIFDAVARSSFHDCRRVLTEQGTFITSEFSPAQLLQGQWISMTGNQKMVPLPPRPPTKVDQVFILEQL
jgi:NADPH:quinone reductase-like Zn-dependent oxidoreductase